MTDQRYLLGCYHRTLETIENRVLEEVSIGPGRRAVSRTLAGLVGCAALAWWLDVIGGELPHAAETVPAVGVGALLVASMVSGLALRLRRYRWCCAAAYCGGLAAVIGIGVFWWARTGQAGISLLWLVVADVAAVTLTAGWLTVICTPIERSQPDMRARFVHAAAKQVK